MKLMTLLLCMMLQQSPFPKYTPPHVPYGHFEQVTVPISQWGHLAQALIYLPNEEKPNDAKKYALIVMFHGKSIAGTDLGKLFHEGILKQIQEGKKIEAVSPVDHKLYRFIVLAPLAPSWSFGPEAFEFILTDILKRYPIDPAHVYLTGYSAGGWSTVMEITHSKALSDRIAAVVPMSPAAIDSANTMNFKYAADVPAWYFAGKMEYNFLQNATRYVDSTNAHKKGLAKFTIHERNHCCFGDNYTPLYKEDGLNIYEWMLQYKR